MKKNATEPMTDDLRPEYDMRELLKGSVRGKHYNAMQAGYTITIHKADGTTEVKEVAPHKGTVVLAPDVLPYFPDSESVNATLRALIRLVPAKPQRGSKKVRTTETKRKSA